MKDKTIEIDVCDTGVTIWVTENYKSENGETYKIKHWIMDASTIKDKGELHLNLNMWRKRFKQNKYDGELFELINKKP